MKIPNQKNENAQLQAVITVNYRELQVNPKAIREFRTKYGLNQNELAQVLGITRQNLSYYEREIRALPEKIAMRILKIWEQKSKF
ncbi:MAG: helix-turn-helix transcriptional regulator [Firmicutes bacterium]|nr:helix-turn-helix transcriptional regulator [Bacillota bacterium]